VEAAKDAGGDGFVNVGHIDAAGIDLGRVEIDGDLGRIDAGDSAQGSRAISTSKSNRWVPSIFPPRQQAARSSQTPEATSALSLYTVTSVERSSWISGDLGKCDIEGSVIGSAAALSGSIAAGGVVKDLNIYRDIARRRWREFRKDQRQQGHRCDHRRWRLSAETARIAGNSRHAINSRRLPSTAMWWAVAVWKVVAWPRQARQRTITIKGDIRGGSGKQSGEVGSSGNISQLTLNGSLLGGSGEQSGSIGTEKGISEVHITGNVVGSTGRGSGPDRKQSDHSRTRRRRFAHRRR
jgi:hypothetical protein